MLKEKYTNTDTKETIYVEPAVFTDAYQLR